MLGEKRCLYNYKCKKKSTNNQTAEYNENTTVKDLQRRAKTGRHKRNANGRSRKECVTKRLWFILQVFCRIDKKKEHWEKICNEWLFLNLKTVAP